MASAIPIFAVVSVVFKNRQRNKKLILRSKLSAYFSPLHYKATRFMGYYNVYYTFNILNKSVHDIGKSTNPVLFFYKYPQVKIHKTGLEVGIMGIPKIFRFLTL